MDLFLQQVVNGLIIGSTYAVVAQGFALVFTVMRVINFAHPDLFMIGMFTGLLVASHLSGSFAVVLVAGALGAALVGLVLERIVLRPLRSRDVLMTLIATLGVAIILQNAMAIAVGPDPVAFPRIVPAGHASLGPIRVSTLQLFNVALSVLLLAGTSFYVRRTKYGRATRAIAERPDVAAAFGVNINLVSQVTVALASMMAGVGGVSIGLLYESGWAYVGLLYGLKAFVCMLVAGNRRIEGVMVAGFALGVLEALVTGYISSSFRDAVAFAVLITVLYYRPNGLFGSYGS